MIAPLTSEIQSVSLIQCYESVRDILVNVGLSVYSYTPSINYKLFRFILQLGRSQSITVCQLLYVYRRSLADRRPRSRLLSVCRL